MHHISVVNGRINKEISQFTTLQLKMLWPCSPSTYGQDALISKIDIKAAFHLIPVPAADWAHLGICWQGQFYVDTCLPFGLRSAPAPSTTTLRHSTGSWPTTMAQLLHYQDDFPLVDPPGQGTCLEAMSRMPIMCDLLGFPVASEKLEGPTTALTFLGIVLDTSARQLGLPQTRWRS